MDEKTILICSFLNRRYGSSLTVILQVLKEICAIFLTYESSVWYEEKSAKLDRNIFKNGKTTT